MTESLNGWDAWYAQWNETYADQADEATPDIIPYVELADWGEAFRQHVMLNDHWTGYLHAEPMSLEDGMSIAFVLYDAGVNVGELLDMLEAFHPFEGAPVEIGIPLCWLTEPMDHVQDLLGMLANVSQLDPEVFEQTQQMFEEVLGEAPLGAEEMPELFRAMTISTVQWLLELIKILGDNGMIALRAWWQGRMIVLLREASTSKRRRRRRQPGRTEMPSAFRDLIQSLDFRGLEGGPEEPGESETPEPDDMPPGRY